MDSLPFLLKDNKERVLEDLLKGGVELWIFAELLDDLDHDGNG